MHIWILASFILGVPPRHAGTASRSELILQYHRILQDSSFAFFVRKSGGATYLSYATSRRSITTFIHLDLIPPPKTDLYPNPYDTPRPRATFPSLKPYSRLHIIPLAAHIITLTFLLLFSVSAFSIYHSSTFYPKVAHIVRQIFI
jgi:hypothetical protein